MLIRRTYSIVFHGAATRTGSDGRGVTIAVIDTGIDYTHPAFGGGCGAGFKVAGGYDFVNDDDPRDDNGLRISITDVRGNETLLTLEPAFFVASDPGRRRAVPSH